MSIFPLLFPFLYTKIILKSKKEHEINESMFDLPQIKQKNLFNTKTSLFGKKEYLSLDLSDNEFDILTKLCLEEYKTETDLTKIGKTILNYCTSACINNFLNNLIKMLKENKQTKSFLLLNILKDSFYLQKFVFMYWELLSLSDDDLCLEPFFNSISNLSIRSNLNYFSQVNQSNYLTLKFTNKTLEEINKNEFLKRALILLEIPNLQIYNVIPEKEFFSKKLVSLKVKNLQSVYDILGDKIKQIVNLSLDIDNEKELCLLRQFINLENLSVSCNLIHPKDIKFNLPKKLSLLELRSSACLFFKKEFLKNLKTLIIIPYREYSKVKELFEAVKQSDLGSFFYSSSKNLLGSEVSILKNTNLTNLQIGDLSEEPVLNENLSVLGVKIEELDDKKINFITKLKKLTDLTLVYKSSPFTQTRKNVTFSTLKGCKLSALTLYLSPFYSYNFDFLEKLNLSKLKINNLNLDLSSMHSTKHELKLVNYSFLTNVQDLSFHRLNLNISATNTKLNCTKFEMVNCDHNNLNLLFKSFTNIKKVKLSFLSLKNDDLISLINQITLEELILNDAFLNENECKMFINQKFKNENIKYIKIKQYDTNFNLEELESFGKKFVNAKIKLNDIGLTVDRIVIHEKQEKEKDYYEYL